MCMYANGYIQGATRGEWTHEWSRWIFPKNAVGAQVPEILKIMNDVRVVQNSDSWASQTLNNPVTIQAKHPKLSSLS